ncbi:hypothetical protein AVEN_161684-1 [Araneus ventricosus]|uniref:Uncharacterized protein n=1 Tax=Araneus ventricosus TaxID=182803 RepID=A0A4Y2LTL0_ARAVE|nr:hypothetical protein AVEN_161684-1 [Araneus ventricosus]
MENQREKPPRNFLAYDSNVGWGIQKSLDKFKDKVKHNHIRNLSHHALSWHPGNLNDSFFNNSSTDAGVLVAITGHGPTRYIQSLEEGTQPSPITIPTSRKENPLTYPAASYPHTHDAPKWEKAKYKETIGRAVRIGL